MAMRADPIRPIYEMPGHKHYGPARRLWVMFEQLFADRGGIRTVEVAVQAHNERLGVRGMRWDASLSGFMDSGLSESAAQRAVIGAVILAAEYVLR